MPVEWLPADLKSALEALLTKKLLNSSKITEENPNVVVMIRLTAVCPPRMAIEPHNAALSFRYRGRPPSQVKRDRKRVDEFQQKKPSSLKENEVSDGSIDAVFDRNLFLPTPPVSRTDKSGHSCDTAVRTCTNLDT